MPTVDADETTLAGALARARARLDACGVADSGTDARLIVEHFTGSSRLDLLRTPRQPLKEGVAAAIDAAIRRRTAGEPVHRILGFREFYGLRLDLSAATLEPRPDTETLVDAMLPHLRKRIRERGRCRILDLGTGTGAIALALLASVPDAVAVGADIAPGALATAAANAERLGLADRFFTLESDWWSRIDGFSDAIVSNPPYIISQAISTLQREVRDFDPHAALDGGEDGLDAYRAIAQGAGKHLLKGGAIGVEIGAGQRDAVAALFEAAGFGLAAVRPDLGGHDRAMIFMR